MLEQWESFTERAAILEYEAGLNRRAATLRAFELHFPGDYRECMRIAGETALYEYLEELIKRPEVALEGPTTSAEPKKTEQHGTAPDGPPQGRETRREGFERMAEYTKGRPA
jgi:hypothetical protein